MCYQWGLPRLVFKKFGEFLRRYWLMTYVDNVAMVLKCPQVIQIMQSKCMNNKQPWVHQGPPDLPQDSVRQGPHAIIYLE